MIGQKIDGVEVSNAVKDILKNGSRGIIFKLTDKSVNKVLNKEVKIVGPIK